MSITITVTFKIRRDTAANWSSINPVLALGEPGLETDSGRVKYGDGSTAWSLLAYSKVDWADILNKPSTFTPSAHTHSAADITSGNLDVARFNGGTGASGSTFWAGDGTWKTPTASAAWGGITGTLSAQTDLQSALDGKAASSHSHSDATGSAAGFMSAADKTKLDGVASGATANSSDAALLNRANHTGSQAISTVTGLQDGLDGKSPVWDFVRQSADRTLTSTTAAQQIFNESTNGAYTPAATGLYEFEAIVYVTNMSATSGNAAFSLAGTATLANQSFHVIGVDHNTPNVAVAQGGTWAFGTSATGTNSVTAGTGTSLAIAVRGQFNVTATGTIIPSIALQTAAAATIKAGSFFRMRKIAETSATTRGSWS